MLKENNISTRFQNPTYSFLHYHLETAKSFIKLYDWKYIINAVHITNANIYRLKITTISTAILDYEFAIE